MKKIMFVVVAMLMGCDSAVVPFDETTTDAGVPVPSVDASPAPDKFAFVPEDDALRLGTPNPKPRVFSRVDGLSSVEVDSGVAPTDPDSGVADAEVPVLTPDAKVPVPTTDAEVPVLTPDSGPGTTDASVPTAPDKGCSHKKHKGCSHKKHKCSANIHIVKNSDANDDCSFMNYGFLNSHLRHIAKESCKKDVGRLFVSKKGGCGKVSVWCAFDWVKVGEQVFVKINCADKSKSYYCSLLFEWKK